MSQKKDLSLAARMAEERKLSFADWMSDKDLQKWVSALGITNAPVPRAGISTALRFFQSQMPMLPVSMALNFLSAMDLSRPVLERTLSMDEKVIAFRHPDESRFKLFYTRPGASKYNSGVNPEGRICVQYSVRNPTPVLESFTTGTVDVWSVLAPGQQATISVRAGKFGFMAMAGGIQLIIPNAVRDLVVTNIQS